MDLLNGATALVHGLTMVTHNVQDYAHVPGLTIDDWLLPCPEPNGAYWAKSKGPFWMALQPPIDLPHCRQRLRGGARGVASSSGVS